MKTGRAKKQIIYRGGTDTERLYLKDLRFSLGKNTPVVIKKSQSVIKNYSMEDHIARHKGRYSLVGLFARPGYKVLDFPCGSGYSSDFLKPFNLEYQGLDNDPVTVAYANRIYGNRKNHFALGNMQKPELKENIYDIGACIEGIEHIEKKYQAPLVRELAKSLKPGGVLIISSPENPTGVSGPSVHNKDHKWEMNKDDFLALLHEIFDKSDVEIVTQTSKLSTGVTTKCLYAICHKK